MDLEHNCRATFRVTGRTSDLGSKLQWILKQTPVQNRFVSQFGLRIWVVSQFGLRILDQNSIVHLETNSCATLFRVTVRTSCLTQNPVQNYFVSQFGLRILFFHRFDFRYWIKTPVDLGKTLQRTMFSCHSSDFGS